MKMNRRDIVIGLVILSIVAGVLYWRQRQTSKENLVVPETLSVEDELESKFDFQIPDDVEKAELTDPSGGSSSGIATRKFENGKFAFAILADLSEPGQGQFYQGWLRRGNEGDLNYAQISVGRVTVAKGGWILNYESTQDLGDYSRVAVTLEKTFDQKPEIRIIEGEF